MVNTINPAECKPGEVYEGTVHGVERTVLIRRDACDSYPWESLGEVLDHEDVSSLVRLVPAREVTRNDLPDHGAILDAFVHWNTDPGPVISHALDAVVARLNANGGLPASCEDAALAGRLERQAATISELQGSFLRVERDAARWRRAHAIVEQERDTAREALDRACLQRNQARTERDRWKAATKRALEHRDEWKARAEAAVARTAPVVTRKDVEKAVGRHIDPERWGVTFPRLANEVCDLFGVEAEPADPVEQKAVELYEAAYPFEGARTWAEVTHIEHETFRRLAAHVLGQEAGQ